MLGFSITEYDKMFVKINLLLKEISGLRSVKSWLWRGLLSYITEFDIKKFNLQQILSK